MEENRIARQNLACRALPPQEREIIGIQFPPSHPNQPKIPRTPVTNIEVNHDANQNADLFQVAAREL